MEIGWEVLAISPFYYFSALPDKAPPFVRTRLGLLPKNSPSLLLLAIYVARVQEWSQALCHDPKVVVPMVRPEQRHNG